MEFEKQVEFVACLTVGEDMIEQVITCFHRWWF